MNLTAAMEKACAQLNEKGIWNGLYVLNASAESESQKREDAKLDELTPEETERYVCDYCCVNFHLDTYDLFESHSEYVTGEIDHGKLQKDFREWLLPFVGNDESVLPHRINLEGGDTEIMKPGY